MEPDNAVSGAKVQTLIHSPQRAATIANEDFYGTTVTTGEAAGTRQFCNLGQSANVDTQSAEGGDHRH